MGLGTPAFGDLELKETSALPNGAATTKGAAIQIQNSSRGDFLAHCLAKISAPALVVGDLANGETVKYSLIDSDSSDLSSERVISADLITQTGAGGAGAAAATATARLPFDCKKYIGVKAVNSGAGDASDKSATLELLF